MSCEIIVVCATDQGGGKVESFISRFGSFTKRFENFIIPFGSFTSYSASFISDFGYLVFVCNINLFHFKEYGIRK